MPTMRDPATLSQAKNGFQLLGLIFLFFGVAGLFLAGVAYSFFPTDHSRALGLTFLAISVPLVIVTMSRWVKVLAGLLALGVLNGVISISTGHLLANPTQPMSRLDAFYVTGFFAAAAALASTLRGRKLNLVDRIALLAFVSCLALLMCYEGTHLRPGAPFNSAYFILMGVSLCCLLIAWGYDYVQDRHGHSSRPESL